MLSEQLDVLVELSKLSFDVIRLRQTSGRVKGWNARLSQRCYWDSGQQNVSRYIKPGCTACDGLKCWPAACTRCPDRVTFSLLGVSSHTCIVSLLHTRTSTPGRLRQCAEINGQSSGHRSMHCSNHSLTRRGLPRPWQHLALSTGACCTSATSPGAPVTGFLYLFEAAQEHSVLGGRWNLTCTWVKVPGIIDPIGN